MTNPKIVFSENGLKTGEKMEYPKLNVYIPHTYRMLKSAAKRDATFINLYKLVKKRIESKSKKAKKYRVKNVFAVINVTDNSFTIQ